MSLETDYSEEISNVFKEFQDEFAALASPTLSKEETLTSLFNSITDQDQRCATILRFPWLRALQFVPRLIMMFVCIGYASMFHRVKSIPENSVVFRTWLVQRSFKETELIDDYFRQLPKELSKNERVIISFTSTDIRLLKKFGKIQTQDNQIISYGLLSLFDVVILFCDYVITGLLKCKNHYTLSGEDITPYINRSLLLDYLELRSFEAYAEKYKCKRLALNKIKSFVYVYENQSWEKVCCDVLRSHGVRLIGYQSSGFSPIFLNFFPTMDDSKQHPMPDILLTVGESFKRYLMQNGKYSIPLETFAALRFSYPTNVGRYIVQPPNLKIIRKVLYAFPVHIDQYYQTIKDLIVVFGGSDILVDLKFHPLYCSSDIEDEFILPKNFNIVNEVDMDTLRYTYDCVLFNDNSFGIESLLKGVKSYQYSRNGSFDDDRFMNFGLWQVNYQIKDLNQLKASIQDGSYDKSFINESVSNYINGMYQPYTCRSLNRFLELIR